MLLQPGMPFRPYAAPAAPNPLPISSYSSSHSIAIVSQFKLFWRPNQFELGAKTT